MSTEPQTASIPRGGILTARSRTVSSRVESCAISKFIRMSRRGISTRFTLSLLAASHRAHHEQQCEAHTKKNSSHRRLDHSFW